MIKENNNKGKEFIKLDDFITHSISMLIPDTTHNYLKVKTVKVKHFKKALTKNEIIREYAKEL